MKLLDITDKDIHKALKSFFQMFLPEGTPVVRGQQNGVPLPDVPCVIMTTIGAPDRIGTNAENTEAVTNAQGEITGFEATAEADFKYTVQADFYSPDAESWSMATELIWRGNIGFGAMPDGMKPLYSDGRQQLPLVGGENQWIERWTMTLVLDYQPTYRQTTQAATTVTVVPEAIDVFFPTAT